VNADLGKGFLLLTVCIFVVVRVTVVVTVLDTATRGLVLSAVAIALLVVAVVGAVVVGFVGHGGGLGRLARVVGCVCGDVKGVAVSLSKGKANTKQIASRKVECTFVTFSKRPNNKVVSPRLVE